MTSDGRLAKAARYEKHFALTFDNVQLAGVVADTDIIATYPIVCRCTPIRFSYTATVVTTTASDDADLILQRTAGNANTTADLSAVTIFDSKLALTSTTTDALGETVTKTITNGIVFEAGDTITIRCTANPTGAFAEGSGTLTIVFKQM